MAVDRAARDRLADLLRHFVANQITNIEFDDHLCRSDDHAVAAILVWFERNQRLMRWRRRTEAMRVWLLRKMEEKSAKASDFKEEMDHLKAMEGKPDKALRERTRILERALLFLETDLAYEWPWRSGSFFSRVFSSRRSRLKRLGTHDRGAWPFLTWKQYKNARRTANRDAGKGYRTLIS